MVWIRVVESGGKRHPAARSICATADCCTTAVFFWTATRRRSRGRCARERARSRQKASNPSAAGSLPSTNICRRPFPWNGSRPPCWSRRLWRKNHPLQRLRRRTGRRLNGCGTRNMRRGRGLTVNHRAAISKKTPLPIRRGVGASANGAGRHRERQGLWGFFRAIAACAAGSHAVRKAADGGGVCAPCRL